MGLKVVRQSPRYVLRLGGFFSLAPLTLPLVDLVCTRKPVVTWFAVHIVPVGFGLVWFGYACVSANVASGGGESVRHSEYLSNLFDARIIGCLGFFVKPAYDCRRFRLAWILAEL